MFPPGRTPKYMKIQWLEVKRCSDLTWHHGVNRPMILSQYPGYPCAYTATITYYGKDYLFVLNLDTVDAGVAITAAWVRLWNPPGGYWCQTWTTHKYPPGVLSGTDYSDYILGSCGGWQIGYDGFCWWQPKPIYE